MDSETFLLEGGDIVQDDDALAEVGIGYDIFLGYSANACVLTCLREGIFFNRKRHINLSVHHMSLHVPLRKS